MKHKTIKCPFCEEYHAHITYEESRVYQLNCTACHNAIFYQDRSWDSAVRFFERLLIVEEGRTDNVTVQKWIPVTERLPDIKKEIDGEIYYRNVAVRVKNLLHERIAYYDPKTECWYDTGFFQIRGVTHWCELPEWDLPEAPKGE